MANTQTPSIGRIVHFYEQMRGEWEGPFAAIVTGVRDDNTISVTVFAGMPHGATTGAGDVLHKDAGGYEGLRYWDWPPRV